MFFQNTNKLCRSALFFVGLCAATLLPLCVWASSTTKPTSAPSETSQPSTKNTGVVKKKKAKGKSLGAIRSLIEKMQKRYKMPSLAALVLMNGKVVALEAVGKRALEKNVLVTVHDRYHLGSCTKAMTATLAAILVEKGLLKWTSRPSEIFPKLAKSFHKDFEKITLLQLLSHRAGVTRSLPQSQPALWRKLYSTKKSTTEARKWVLEAILSKPASILPGKKFSYSNAGYMIAGAMLEAVTKKSWEELMQDHLFRPLQMNSCGFGVSDKTGKLRQPWGHRRVKGKRVSVKPSKIADNPPALGPAGTVHCSLTDWARFVKLHLQGARGEKGLLLKPSSFHILHSPLSKRPPYALGWIVTKRPWSKGKAFVHAGSNTMNFSVVWMAPRRKFAILIVSNDGQGTTYKGMDRLTGLLVRHFLTP